MQIGDQRIGTRIRQHALHLRFEPGLVMEPTTLGDLQQLFIRHAAPQEERQP